MLPESNIYNPNIRVIWYSFGVYCEWYTHYADGKRIRYNYTQETLGM